MATRYQTTINRILRNTLYLFILLSQTTCIEPLDVKPSDIEEFLVIQGFINNDFGPHEIRISRIAPFTSVSEGGQINLEDAIVRIIDQDSVITPLQRETIQRKELIPMDEPHPVPCAPIWLTFAEIQTDYRTPVTFKGEIGNTYILEILTRQGKTYRSTPQTMLPTIPIEALSLAFKTLPGLDPVVPISGVEVSASWLDPVNDENYYFWRLNGIYHISSPDLSTATRCCPYDPRDGGVTSCWINEKNIGGDNLTYSDERVNGQLVTQVVGFIEDDGLRFGDQSFVAADEIYHVEVEQYSISQAAYEFREKILTLANINGEIFDPPPISIRGNIKNTKDNKEPVVGFFGAYAKETRSIFIPKSILEFTQFYPQPCGDCRTRGGAQVEIPEPYR